MSTLLSSLDATLSVNETIRRYPATLAVMNAYGVDTCCGGAESLASAAETSGITVEALMAGLSLAIGGNEPLARGGEA